MIHTLTEYIQVVAAYAPTWGFLLVLLFMTIESSFIPFPSEVVMIPAGFLAARGELTFGSPGLDAITAVLFGTAGSLAGAYVNYFLAMYAGKPFLANYGKYLFLPPDKLERAEEVFRQYGAGATFVCRLLPAIRQLISIPAGLARMPLGAFTFWTALGAGLWVSVLTYAGYYVGMSTVAMSYPELIASTSQAVRQNMLYLIPVLLVGFAGYVFVSNQIMKRQGPARATAQVKD